MNKCIRKRRTCDKCKESWHPTYYRNHICIPQSTDEVTGDKNEGCKRVRKEIPDNVENSNIAVHDHDDVNNNALPHVTNIEDVDGMENYITMDESISTESQQNDSGFSDDDLQSVINETNATGDMVISIADRDQQMKLMSTFLIKWQSLFKIPNVGVECLIKFLRVFLKSTFPVAIDIPSYNKLRDSIEDHIRIRKYVICRNCYHLFDILECTRTVEGAITTRNCCFRIPEQVKCSSKYICNEPLLHSSVVGGKTVWRPYLTYCYRSLEVSIQEMLLRPNFHAHCKSWTLREVPDDTIEDVFDGLMWKEWVAKGYFKENNDLAVMLQVDWFQPFNRQTSSIGAVYLVLLNLPLHERFKRQNYILLGVIPDIHPEPKVNTFLKPLVDELLVAFSDGFDLYTYDSPSETQNFRVILLCVSCDLPATRKVCGFLSHTAKLGCSKCKQEFTREKETKKLCCGTFNYKKWEKRTNEEQRSMIAVIRRSAASKAEREKLERKKGARWCELIRLDYFDIVRMHIVDPMHNLLLGTAKHVHVCWLKDGTLTKKHLEQIQKEMETFVVPSNVGRLPLKIASGMMTFTANEWKNWTLVYSLVLLKGKIGEDHLKCWRYFVQAMSFLYNKSLKKDILSNVHRLLMRFGKMCIKLYTKSFIKPNMHLHGHLVDCIRDYGPMYVFWTFAMERMNGMLGSQPNNNKDIGEQVMKKLLQQMHVYGSDDFGVTSNTTLGTKCSDLEEFVSKLGNERFVGNVTNSMHSKNLYQFEFLSTTACNIQATDWSFSNDDFTVPKKCQTKLLENDLMYSNLVKMYGHVYPQQQLFVTKIIHEFKKIKFGCKEFGTKHQGGISSAFIRAYWLGDDPSDISGEWLLPGKIKNIFKNTILLNDEPKLHVIAEIEWFTSIPQILNYYGKPIEVFSEFPIEPGIASYIPLQRIHSTVACSYQKVEGNRSAVICPITRDTNW